MRINNSLDYERLNFPILWHRSRVIFTFDSTYPYNTVKAFFWKARRGDFEDWVFDEKKMKVFNIESTDAKEIQFKNGIFVFRRHTETEPTVIEVSELEKKSIFQVIMTGDPDQADDEIKEFLDVLHRQIDLSRADRRLIYSEQFIRYNDFCSLYEIPKVQIDRAQFTQIVKISVLFMRFRGTPLGEKMQAELEISVLFMRFRASGWRSEMGDKRVADFCSLYEILVRRYEKAKQEGGKISVLFMRFLCIVCRMGWQRMPILISVLFMRFHSQNSRE